MLPAMSDRHLPPTADRIADGYWDALLALRPTLATYVGDDRFDDRLDDPGPAGRAAVRSLHERTLAELDRLGPGPGDDVTGDILRFVCEAELAVDAQRLAAPRVGQPGRGTAAPALVHGPGPGLRHT